MFTRKRKDGRGLGTGKEDTVGYYLRRQKNKEEKIWEGNTENGKKRYVENQMKRRIVN